MLEAGTYSTIDFEPPLTYTVPARWDNPFYMHFAAGTPGVGAHTMQKSFDGGKNWTQPRDIFSVNDACYHIDIVSGRCVADGGAGARIDLPAMPSIDIANGAPSGADATNEIVDVWGDGRLGLNHEVALLSHSTDAGETWTDPTTASLPGDRPIYAAPAIAPDGKAVYVIYEALTDPWRGSDMPSPRLAGRRRSRSRRSRRPAAMAARACPSRAPASSSTRWVTG